MQNRILALLFLFPLALLAQTPKLVIPTGHNFAPEQAKTDPSGRFWVSADIKGLLLWDKKSRVQLRNFNADGFKTHDFCFSPDGKQVLAAQGELICYNMADGRERWKIKPDYTMYSAAYFDNGQKIIAIGSGYGYILAAATGAILQKIEGFGVQAARVFALESGLAVLISGDILKTVNLNSPGVPTEIKFNAYLQDYAVDTKRGHLFFQEGESINVFDLKTGKTTKTLPLDEYNPHFTITDEMDALLVEFQATEPPYKRKLLKYALPAPGTPQTVKQPEMANEIRLLTASGKGDYLHFTTGEIVRLSSGAAVGTLGGSVSSLGMPASAPPSYWGAEQLFGFMKVRDSEFRLLDLKTGQTRAALDLTRADGLGESDFFDFSADGSQFVVQNRERTAFLLFDVKTKKLRKSYPRPSQTDGAFLKFSADGKSVFTHSRESGGITALNLATGAFRNVCKTWEGGYYAISPNAKYAACLGRTGEVWSVGVWELETGKQLAMMQHGELGFLYSMDVSADGKFVIVNGETGGTKMYDVAAKRAVDDDKITTFGFSASRFSPTSHYYAVGENRGNLTVGKMPGGDRFAVKPHGNSINSILFSADEKVVFTAASDHSIGLSAMLDGKFLGSLYGFDDPKDWLIVTPDGRFDGSPDAFKKIYYVSGFDVLPLDALFEKYYTPGLFAMLLSGEKLDPVADDISKLKAAPKVKITFDGKQRNLVVEDDAPSFNSETEQISLKIEATCPEDAVTEIRLYQNGKLVQSTRNLVVEDDAPTGEKTMLKTFAVTLSEGENKFRAVAYNTQRTESQPAEITVVFKNAKPAPSVGGMNCWLVVVAVNQYKNPKYNLNYATADAKAFKTSIEEHAGTIFSKINAEIVQDAEATKSGIMAALNRAKAAAGPKDLLIFYFAGHGVMAGDDGKQTFYLVPQDVTQIYGNDEALAQKGLSVNDLRAFSQETKAQKQLFILDACQSAGALEGIAMRGAAEEKAIAQLARSTGTHWLTASGSEQFASEFDELGHGSFTYVLLEALAGKADMGGDGKVTVKEIDAYLQEKVPEITKKYKGTPQYPASYGFGNDFPIGVVKK